MSGPPYDPARLRQVAGEIVSTARELAARGWTPATSSNFSMRLGEAHAAITVSGLDKGRLTEEGVMVVDLDGRPVATGERPSAETVLHTRLYRRDPGIGCVLHTHSLVQTVASRVFAPNGGVRLKGYELAKAIAGTMTHETVIELPVLANSQDVPAMAGQVEALFDAGPLSGYLIAGHGLYAWGRDLAEARRHLEAFEFMLACELELRRLT
ncbi:MAG TPA: methylthioribulose 1-phosphate dehydratase [Propionibacteriaceae bacterium]|nr:methylthioribulose 1-phosphate dehydratase [Propionibacteriaceae bacterium]